MALRLTESRSPRRPTYKLGKYEKQTRNCVLKFAAPRVKMHMDRNYANKQGFGAFKGVASNVPKTSHLSRLRKHPFHPIPGITEPVMSQ